MAVQRRHFLTLLGGALAVGHSPSLAQAQPRVPKAGFLMGLANDPEAQARAKAFEEQLAKEGWVPGKDIELEYRYAGGDANRTQAFAKELVALKPAVLIGHSTPVVVQLAKATSTIPIVFVVVADPVGAGFAESIARPGRNMTGFTNLDPTITGKLLMMLRELTPKMGTVSLLFNPQTVTSGGNFQAYVDALQVAAASFGIEVVISKVQEPAHIERELTTLGSKSQPGLIVMPDNFNTVNRDLIISLAARYRIPAIYPYRYFVDAGGLMSYGVDVRDLFRRAPQYVGRILRGANPGELPIQAPTKFELVINLKTAKSLNISMPKILLASADALVE